MYGFELVSYGSSTTASLGNRLLWREITSSPAIRAGAGRSEIGLAAAKRK